MNRDATIRLINELEEELDRLARVADLIHEAQARFAAAPPDPLELGGIGNLLHGFYNGVENIFKRVAGELNGGLPSGGDWHSQLLQDMTLNLSGLRPPVISRDTATRLKKYLDFRHLFRHLYGFDLEWPPVWLLITSFDAAYLPFVSEVRRFLEFLRSMLEDAQ